MIIACANQKGGTGKTSTTAMLAFELAKMGKKVLCVDCDPQTNLTQLLVKTADQENGIIAIDNSLFSLLVNNKPLKDGIKSIMSNLDLLPSAIDLNMFSRWLDKQGVSENKKVSYLSTRLKPLAKDYDFIFLDPSPTMSLLNDNVFFACDYLIIMLQTQERSLLGAKDFLGYLQSNLVNQFNAKTDVLGLLPVLSKKSSKIDEFILDQAKNIFGEKNIFNTKVETMERIKRYDLTGITSNNTVWDNRTHEVFKQAAEELIERLNK